MESPLKIIDVQDNSDLEAVKDLCREFRLWLYERYADDHASIDQYYNPAQFESLLEKLTILHAKPDGVILLAKHNNEVAACVMLSKFDASSCEMKRLFVKPEKRGYGIATELCNALFETAKANHYEFMRLDTGEFHHEALSLYERLGFKRRDAYYDPGPVWRNRLIYMEKPL